MMRICLSIKTGNRRQSSKQPVHLGTYIPQGGARHVRFNGIDTSQCTGDTVALTYPSGISGLGSAVKLRCNGNGVELIGNTR